MKNNVKYLFSAVVLFMLASSFTTRPVSSDTYLWGGVYLEFAGKFGGDITPQEITGQTEIKIKGCHPDARVSAFTLSVTKNGKTSTFSATTRVLTAEMITKLKSLSKGDEFEFRNTKAYLPGGKDVVDVHGKKFVVV